MVALPNHLGLLALFLGGSDAARISRKRSAADTKFIAGVPMLNYDLAYEGTGILAEQESEVEQDWVVMVNKATTDEQIAAMCKASKNGCNLVGSPSRGGVPFLELRATESDLNEVLRMSSGSVTFVEPDTLVRVVPELEVDGVKAATWGLGRIGADGRSRAGAGTSIYILDTGVRVSHQQFGGRAVPTLDMTVGEPLECNGDVSCARDQQGHGTHCAGTAAGETFGVAPQATLKSMKVLGDRGSGQWSWTYGALDWLARSGEVGRVASMSLGGQGTLYAMRDAVNAAVDAGVAVVVAAGNENDDACRFSPAFVPAAITVGSTTSEDARSGFSNYGSCTNIWAPGSQIISAEHTSDDGSVAFSGTSMACPHVAGGAALLLQADPSMKPSAVLAALHENAATDVVSGLRETDTNKLLYVGEGGAPPSPTVVPTPPPPQRCYSWCDRTWCDTQFCGGCQYC